VQPVFKLVLEMRVPRQRIVVLRPEILGNVGTTEFQTDDVVDFEVAGRARSGGKSATSGGNILGRMNSGAAHLNIGWSATFRSDRHATHHA
jgi:hypothetical protein